MITITAGDANRGRTRQAMLSVASLVVLFFAVFQSRADDPYACRRDYDLQHSKIALRCDLDQKKVLGDVTHSLSILKDGTAKLAFDSAGLTIQSVTANKTTGDRKSAGAAAKFEIISDKLIVPLPEAAKPGENITLPIPYTATPTPSRHL